MNNKHYVPLGQATELKELGFKERVLTYYEDGKPKLHDHISGWDYNSSFLTCVSRPTFAEAFDWFHEKHMIRVEVRKHTRDGLQCFNPFISNSPVKEDVFFNDYDSPTEALEIGLQEALKLLPCQN